MSRIDLGDILDVITAVRPVINKAAKSDKVSLQQKDAPGLTTDVASAVNDNVAVAQKEVDAVIKNLENKEPWYQSRVILGTLITGILQLASFIGLQTDTIEPEGVTNIVMQGVSFLGAAFALYGRLVTNKPLGE